MKYMFAKLKKHRRLTRWLCGLCAVIIIGIFLPIIALVSGSAKAMLVVESDVEVYVFVDGVQIGKTPVEYETEKQKIVLTLKKNPDSSPLYSAPLSLTPRTKNIVRQNFGENYDLLFGQVLQFTPTTANGVKMLLTSKPFFAEVFLDDQFVGTTPLQVEVPSSESVVTFKKEGFEDSSVSVSPAMGYELNIHASLLWQQNKPTVSGANSVSNVTIGSNPSGFVRVRSGPTPYSDEVARVKSGESYQITYENEGLEWVEIMVSESIKGWVKKDQTIKAN